jgi:hypothetical protein
MGTDSSGHIVLHTTVSTHNIYCYINLHDMGKCDLNSCPRGLLDGFNSMANGLAVR